MFSFIIRSTHVHCASMVEEPISLSFAFWPRSNIGTDKSAAYSGATIALFIPNSNSFICGASHRDAVSIIFYGLWYDSASGGLEP